MVLIKPAPRPNEPVTMPMGEAVARLLPGAVYRELEPTHEDQDDVFDEVRILARECHELVIATVARPAAWSTFGLAARERRFATRLMEAHPTTLVVLGDLRGLRGYDACDAALVTFSPTWPSARWPPSSGWPAATAADPAPPDWRGPAGRVARWNRRPPTTL